MASVHQVNHPGKEFPISFERRKQHADDYFFFNNSYSRGLRKWNRKPNPHYRKFMVHKGKYVSKADATIEIEALLNFWGEFEGPSEFTLVQHNPNEKYWNNPTAIHKPLFIDEERGDQNTDPYIFGERFLYAICKKTELDNLSPGDIMLFGSEFGAKPDVHFYLDTLMVIKDEISVVGSEFDALYRELTLDRLKDEQTGQSLTNSVHTGVTFADRKEAVGCFSFVPVREAGNYPLGFGRPVLKNELITKYLRKPGAYTGYKSTALKDKNELKTLWQLIATEVLKQGFYLGTGFEEVK
ncbi:hypothetical protein L21SP5_03763 [Salinivirga cyanobacteriivorans]|uniref:Uncharacterized protein n=1 Tax=Salinivirga cyanobacteriivorans TaxID=1307839 RepID=A0A0S2I531_9BACT|nr:hypothetical protein [Salinivirga cyanobacteriivorans]ALO17358.1 hypothetical protein L21SP5_03763 [Salinivirga cyanobacteriivorans]